MTAPADEHLLGNACREMTIEASRVPLSQDMDQRLLALIQETPDKRHQEDPKGLIVDYAHVQGKGEDGALAIIGSLFRREPSEDGVTLLSFQISCLNLDEQPDPPPKEKFSPLEDLLGITSQLGEVEVNCSASLCLQYGCVENPVALSPPARRVRGHAHRVSCAEPKERQKGKWPIPSKSNRRATARWAHTVTIEARGVVSWQGLRNIRIIVEDLSKTLLKEERDSV